MAGIVSLGLGIAGMAVPLLPTTPLVVLTAFCFAKGSRRLHAWFLSTAFYRKYVESFASRRAMNVKNKLALLAAVTACMGVSFLVMHIASAPMAARAALAVVWLCHVLYFGFRVKTL
jgi:hypothetical protein